MATIVTNAEASELPVELRQQAYNVMDACVTGGIMEALRGKVEADPEAALVYEFERSMQGPAFTMALRGIAVDEAAAKATITGLLNAEAHCIVNLRKCAAVWLGEEVSGTVEVVEVLKGLRGGKATPGMSPHSPKWVSRLFYGELEEGGCEEKAYKRRAKKPSNAEGESSSTANEEALMMLQARAPVVGVMTHLVLRARELRKLRGFVAARRSPDGRLRSSFNVGATTSGRWSFSKNCFGEGLNFGNIPKGARGMFVPSTASRVMVNVDLKQAESYVVAHLANDEAYIKAHETGDAHTAIAVDVYRELMPAGCEDVGAWARAPNPRLARSESPRQNCKKIGHGTNYGIGERKSSKITGMPIKAIVDFRKRFFERYVGVKARIDGVEERLLTNNRFVSFMGRPHQHLGNPRDGETHRAALADEPQGGVADILNIVLWRLWSTYDVGGCAPRMYMLSQAYDSILFECEERELEAVRGAVARAFRVEVSINGRTVVVPHDFGWGRNWKEACS